MIQEAQALLCEAEFKEIGERESLSNRLNDIVSQFERQKLMQARNSEKPKEGSSDKFIGMVDRMKRD